MAETTSPRCRMVACREPLDDDAAWSFYLINDASHPLHVVTLEEVAYEWGGFANSEPADVRIDHLAPGAAALLWRDDGDGAELRMELTVRIRTAGRETRVAFEFPKLDKKRDLPVVEGLDKPGWEELGRIRSG